MGKLAGKAGVAPCGHSGEHIVANYVRCLTKGCDGLPPQSKPEEDFSDFMLEEDTLPLGLICPACASNKIAPFNNPWFGVKSGQYHCLPCGKVF